MLSPPSVYYIMSRENIENEGIIFNWVLFTKFLDIHAEVWCKWIITQLHFHLSNKIYSTVDIENTISLTLSTYRIWFMVQSAALSQFTVVNKTYTNHNGMDFPH